MTWHLRPAGSARLLVSGLVLAIGLFACAGQDDATPEDIPPASNETVERAPEAVTISEIGLATLEVPVTASGSTQARRVSGLGAELAGRILAIYVDVGDRVEAGTELFALDPVPYQAALDEARAGLALARAEHQNAIHEERRVERLVEQRAASEAQREQRRTAEDVATARVAQMEARLARVQSDLERTVIRAPYAGTVVDRRAHEGDMAGREPVVVLQENGALVAVLNIPESTLVPVRVGAPLQIHAAGLRAPIAARVDRVSERVDPETRTYEVRATVEDPSGTVKAGSYIYAEITATPASPRPVVDRSALLMRDGRTYLFKLEGGHVRQLDVRVGAVTEERVEILSGADVGDRVVNGDAVGRLTDGDAVRVTSAELARTAKNGAAR
jgi:RND family efflux transporter MFP subunit